MPQAFLMEKKMWTYSNSGGAQFYFFMPRNIYPPLNCLTYIKVESFMLEFVTLLLQHFNTVKIYSGDVLSRTSDLCYQTTAKSSFFSTSSSNCNICYNRICKIRLNAFLLVSKCNPNNILRSQSMGVTCSLSQICKDSAIFNHTKEGI